MRKRKTIILLVTSLLLSIEAQAAEHFKPKYKITEGKGYTLCEAYLRNLRAFAAAEKNPICHPRPHSSNREFREISWTPMDIGNNVELIYKAEMSWGSYANHPERHPPYSQWLEEFEADIRSGAIRPSLKQASVEFVKGRPDTFVAYARNPEGCEAELANIGYSQSAGHHLFLFDESKRALKRIHFLTSNGGSVLLFKGQPVVVNALGSADEIYVWRQFQQSKVFQTQRLCRIRVDDAK